MCCRLRAGPPWSLRHRQMAGKVHPAPEPGPLVLGPHLPAGATGLSSHSARHGPRSRGGKIQQSPRKARHGHPHQAGASAQAGSGRGPRPSWSCCSGCACWWTAGSGSGSGCGDDRGVSQTPWLLPLGQSLPPASAGPSGHESQVRCSFLILGFCIYI